MVEVEDYIWIRNQFKGVDLPDLRLVDRLEEIACRVIAKPASSIPKQNNEWRDIKAAYRFYDSNKVRFCKLIQPHVSQTKKKVAKMKQILAIQDTCFISYIKAAYRFYDSNKVRFCKLIQPHVSQTKKKVAKMKQILAIQDTCFISYS